MDDELLVHEDDIVAAKPLGLLEVTQRQEAMNLGFDLNDPEQLEAYQQAQEVALFGKRAHTRHQTGSGRYRWIHPYAAGRINCKRMVLGHSTR